MLRSSVGLLRYQLNFPSLDIWVPLTARTGNLIRLNVNLDNKVMYLCRFPYVVEQGNLVEELPWDAEQGSEEESREADRLVVAVHSVKRSVLRLKLHHVAKLLYLLQRGCLVESPHRPNEDVVEHTASLTDVMFDVSCTTKYGKSKKQISQ